MGCKEARAQAPQLLYRTKSIRQLLASKKAHESGSFSSVIDEDSRESGDSSRKEGGMWARRRLETEGNRAVSMPKSTQIDIKVAVRIKQNRTKSLLQLAKPQPRPPQLVQSPAAFPLLSPSQIQTSFKRISGFDESDFSANDPICLYSTSIFKKRPQGKAAVKPVQSSYKLLRASRKPASWDPTASAEGNIGKDASLVSIIKESADIGRVTRRNRSIKQLIGQGNYAFSSPKTSEDASLFDSIRGKKEGSDSKVTYMIKTPQAFGFKESESQRQRRERGKSRAERTWAWKGSKGAFEAN